MSTVNAILVDDDRDRGLFRVNRRVFTEADLLEKEWDAIFDRCWLYAGHESEVRNPGDYVTRKIARRPLILVRGQDGVVRALLNTCPHRGNRVCREPKGNARGFTCFYHAWSFDTRGDLIGLPGDDAYAEAFDRTQMGLMPVPRFASYRGFLFVCFDPAAVDLADYLGEAGRQNIDYFIDSGGGEVEISAGAQSYSMKANWKLLAENSMDSYHGISTHQRYFRTYLPDIGVQSNRRPGRRPDSRGISLGNGHAVTLKPRYQTALTGKANEELAAQRAALDDKFGVEKAKEIGDFDRNLFIFPNLILISTWRTVRTFYPTSPDFVEIDAWALLPCGESEELRQKRYQNFISFLGPAGFGTPDDVTALEGCQQGFAAKEMEWSDISRGMKRASPESIDELQMRAFWRRWHALMQGQTGETDCADAPDQLVAS